MNEVSEHKKTIHEQLLAAQKEMVPVSKDANNPFFKSKYADINAIMEVAKPALNNNGLYLSHHMIVMEGKDYVVTKVTNEDGESIECAVPVIVKAQNDPQALGSSITYARRYGLSALLAVETEDDDGNAASKPAPKPSKMTRSQQRTIGDLMKLKGVGADQLSDLIGGKKSSEMTEDEAENLIYYLNKQADRVQDKDIVREKPVAVDTSELKEEDLEAIFNEKPKEEVKPQEVDPKTVPLF